VVDEYQKSAAKTWFEMINHCPAYWRIGQTATPFRGSELEDQYLYANTGPIIASVKTDELQESGYLAQTDIRFVKCSLYPSSMVYNTTIDDLTDEEIGWVDAKFVHKYRECIVENAERNQMVAKLVNKHLENGDKILVIVAWTSHADNLIPLFNAEPIYLSGNDTKKQSKEKTEAFDTLPSGVLIGSPVIDVGYDIPNVTTIVNASAGASSGRTQQRLGRGLRITDEKTSVIYYDFADEDIGVRKKHFAKHAKARMKTFKTLGQTITVYDTVEEALGSDSDAKSL